MEGGKENYSQNWGPEKKSALKNTLSLEFLKKIKSFFIFNFLEEKNYDTVTSGQDFLPD
jgi:ATP-dependent Clp protease ATP-binding subunit ClpA